jgi:hypothetical protein
MGGEILGAEQVGEALKEGMGPAPRHACQVDYPLSEDRSKKLALFMQKVTYLHGLPIVSCLGTKKHVEKYQSLPVI